MAITFINSHRPDVIMEKSDRGFWTCNVWRRFLTILSLGCAYLLTPFDTWISYNLQHALTAFKTAWWPTRALGSPFSSLIVALILEFSLLGARLTTASLRNKFKRKALFNTLANPWTSRAVVVFVLCRYLRQCTARYQWWASLWLMWAHSVLVAYVRPGRDHVHM